LRVVDPHHSDPAGGADDLNELVQHHFRMLVATFLDCAGVRALAIATCFAPSGCPVIIRSLSSPARRIITVLGTDDIENLRRLTAVPEHRDGLPGGVASEQEFAPLTWAELELDV
jgi:hypothetical protein